ncbi:uncharacterized protein LOC126831917 [Patella vulgata]|uniref:uncharacterized protein LOC126831917 n=1 Tax=Patella vulgata TaxID=6465 RepID=UPI0021807763|nr:uncharacterized protein LOC126831917 [Patella vulgata]
MVLFQYVLAIFSAGLVSGQYAPIHFWPLDNVTYGFDMVPFIPLMWEIAQYDVCFEFGDGHPSTTNEATKFGGADTSYLDFRMFQRYFQTTFTFAFLVFVEEFSSGTILHLTGDCALKAVCNMSLVLVDDKLQFTIWDSSIGLCASLQSSHVFSTATWNYVAIKRSTTETTLILNNLSESVPDSCSRPASDFGQSILRLGGSIDNVDDRFRGRMQCVAFLESYADFATEMSDLLIECNKARIPQSDSFMCNIDDHLPSKSRMFGLKGADKRPSVNAPPLLILTSTTFVSCATECFRSETCKAIIINTSVTNNNCELYDFVETHALIPSPGAQYFAITNIL